MNALASPPLTTVSLSSLTGEISPTVLKWASSAIAAALHLGLGAAALYLLHAPTPQPLSDRTIQLTMVTVPDLEPEPVVEPEPSVAPQPVVEPAPAPAPPALNSDRAPVEPAPVPQRPAETASPAPPPAEPAPQQVLTAEGGQAGWAPDAEPAVSERTAGALRGLLCAGGSEHTRAAAGCDPAAQTDPNGYAAFASADEIAKVETAFGPIETLGYAGGSTVNLGSFALPGQVNTNQPHYLSGVHSAFGRLPVSDKARDPGFGD
jgi:outer membrane biosynthesis protein TonB